MQCDVLRGLLPEILCFDSRWKQRIRISGFWFLISDRSVVVVFFFCEIHSVL